MSSKGNYDLLRAKIIDRLCLLNRRPKPFWEKIFANKYNEGQVAAYILVLKEITPLETQQQ